MEGEVQVETSSAQEARIKKVLKQEHAMLKYEKDEMKENRRRMKAEAKKEEGDGFDCFF